MGDFPVSMSALGGACAKTRYEVIINGGAYAVRTARLVPGADGEQAVLEAVMDDDSILPHLTGTMLGPNRDYAEIRVRGTGEAPHTIYANLTSYAHVSSQLTLRLAVLRALHGA